LGLAGILIIGGMLFQCYKDLKFVRTKFTPAESRQKHGQTIRAKEDIRVYLAMAMEGSLIGFSVSGVFISILWYPSLWIMLALVVALRNISETQSEGGPLGVVRAQYPQGSSLPRYGERPVSRL
jgi:hypothetical protein